MRLHIPIKIWRQLLSYAQLSAPNEITGIGTVVAIDNESLRVTEIFLPKQVASTVDCEFAEGELNAIVYDLLTREDSARAKELRFRWHSHGLGQVFWSQKDEQDINDWDSSWVVNLVMNAMSEYLVRFDYFEPLRVRNYPVKLIIDYPEDAELRRGCAQEIEEKVTFSNAGQFFRKEP